MAKRYRGRSPSAIKFPPMGAWPYIPMKKRGPRKEREKLAQIAVDTNIYRALAQRLPEVPDFRIHWEGVPSAETQAAMVEMIVAAAQHIWLPPKQLKPGAWTIPEPAQVGKKAMVTP